MNVKILLERRKKYVKKEILNEKWISFDDNEKLNDEIANIELARLVYEADKNRKKYNNKNINKKLKERIDNLDTFEREIENITNIFIMRGANINNNLEFNNNYLVIEDKYGPNVILDLDKGIDESYRFRSFCLCQKTKIESLYSDEGRSSIFKLCTIKEVNYYSKGKLINSYSTSEICKDYILEIIDNLNNKIYIDCLCKNLYIDRNNYEVINYKDNIKLFNNGCVSETPKRLLDNKYKVINLFTEVVDE